MYSVPLFVFVLSNPSMLFQGNSTFLTFTQSQCFPFRSAFVRRRESSETTIRSLMCDSRRPAQWSIITTHITNNGQYHHRISEDATAIAKLIDEQGQQLVSGPYRFVSSPTVNGWFNAGGYPPDSWNGITSFIDRYGNTTFTGEEMRQIERWHNEKPRSRK